MRERPMFEKVACMARQQSGEVGEFCRGGKTYEEEKRSG